MSQALLDFIKAWSSTKDAAQLLDLNISLPDANEASAFLNTLDEGERINIEESLAEALIVLEHHLIKLKLDQADIKQQLDQADKVSKACLTYARTPQKSQT